MTKRTSINGIGRFGRGRGYCVGRSGRGCGSRAGNIKEGHTQKTPTALKPLLWCSGGVTHDGPGRAGQRKLAARALASRSWAAGVLDSGSCALARLQPPTGATIAPLANPDGASGRA